MTHPPRRPFFPRLLILALAVLAAARAEDGYRLWLRYDLIEDATQRKTCAEALARITLATPGGVETPALAAARDELQAALAGLLGPDANCSVEIGRAEHDAALGDEGYALRRSSAAGMVISANRDIGALYGAFELLRRVQTRQPLDALDFASTPRIRLRLLNHWDNLDRFVERGYAGFSLWKWFTLPDVIEPRSPTCSGPTASASISPPASARPSKSAVSPPPIRSIPPSPRGGAGKPPRFINSFPTSAASS
ncbi:hypothetical protein OH491_20670 [Termitidicoccus mucosus]